MKATISKGELKFALNAVCKTASNAAANLACVLIDARDAVMRFETNDGVCASKYESLALIDEPGRLLLPANYLSDIVGDLPDEAIGVSSDGTGCILSYGKSSVRISGLDPDEFQGFPPLKPEHTATIKAETFSGMVKMCAKFASKNNERPIFCCINVSAKDGDLTMRATDSYRLVEVADTAQAGSGEFVCNLPARFAVQFASSFQTGDVDMAVAGNQIILSSGPLTCMTRAVEGNYPDFTRFFATEYGNVAVFERHEAIPVIKRAKTVGRWSHEALRLSLSDGAVKVELSSSELGSVAEDIPCDEFSGGHVFANVSAAFLFDVFSAMPDERIELRIENGISPVSVKSGNARAVLMPIRGAK